MGGKASRRRRRGRPARTARPNPPETRKPAARSSPDVAALLDGLANARTSAERDLFTRLVYEHLGLSYRPPWSRRIWPLRQLADLADRFGTWRIHRGYAAGARMTRREQQAKVRQRRDEERLKKRLGLEEEDGGWERYYTPD